MGEGLLFEISPIGSGALRSYLRSISTIASSPMTVAPASVRRDECGDAEISPLKKRNARNHLMVHVKKSAPAGKKPKAKKPKAKAPKRAAKPVAPEPEPDEAGPDWAAIRLLYEDRSNALTAIADFAGVSAQKVIRHATVNGWQSRTAAKYRDAPASELMGSALKPVRLATRLKRLIAREIESIEGEIAHERDAVEKERDARRLSTLVRSLEKLNDIKAAKAKREPKSGDTAEDAEALRAELERRLARIAAGDNAGGVPCEPRPEGNGLAA